MEGPVRSGPYVDARAHGARGDGEADDHESLARALAAAVRAGGGFVFLAAGTYRVGATVRLPVGTGLLGAGRHATTIRAAPGLDAPVVANLVSADGLAPNGQLVYVGHLRIDGNRDGQTDGDDRHGIYLSQFPIYDQAMQDWDFDSHQLIEHVIVTRCRNTGVWAQARSETRMINVVSNFNGDHGFRPSFDSFLQACTGSHNGGCGFVLDESSIRLSQCKAFYNGEGGQVDNGDRGPGFSLRNAQGGLSLSACEAQDNAGSGFAFLDASNNTLVGCVADSNSSHAVNETVAPGTYAGFDFARSSGNVMAGCIAYDRLYQGETFQVNAVHLGEGSTGNRIDILHRGANGAAIGAAITGPSAAGNAIRVNTQDGSQSVAWAETITPNPYAGDLFVTLAGDVTFAAPSDGHLGCRLRFVIRQDEEGGRIVTWDPAYRFVSGWRANMAGGEYTLVAFQHDGTAWLQVG